jgi:hypothetical protein
MSKKFAGAVVLLLVGVCSAVYDEKFSQKAVYYSEAAFCEKEDLDNWKCGKSCEMIPGVSSATRVLNDQTGVFGFVAYNHIDD